MAGLLGYALAGAAAGAGQGIVDRAKAILERDAAAAERAQEVEDRDLKRKWEVEDRDLAYARRKGGGGGGGRRRGSGGSSSSSSDDEGFIPSSRGGLMGNPMALDEQGTVREDFPLYGSLGDSPDEVTGSSDLPRRATAKDKLVNRYRAKDGSYRAFTKDTNEPVLLTDPTESEDDDSDTPAKKKGNGEPKTLTATEQTRITKALEDKRGNAADGELTANVLAEVEDLMNSENMSASQAAADVLGRLDREDRVTNPAGTALSRAVGWTDEDAPPDEVVPNPEGRIKGIKPRGGGLLGNSTPPDGRNNNARRPTSFDEMEQPQPAEGAKDYPPAPRDPAQRKVGEIYMAPAGFPVRWMGTGWERVSG